MSRGKFLSSGIDLWAHFQLIRIIGCMFEQFEVVMKSMQVGRHPDS
jgi:hypothetical protein